MALQIEREYTNSNIILAQFIEAIQEPQWNKVSLCRHSNTI